jgi:hypothetical protein
MQLTYTNADQTTIEAMLDAGETLGHVTGPMTLYVPTDAANAEYADILEHGYPIDPYVPPPEPEPQPLTLEAQPEGLMDAATMSSVKVFVHEELVPLTESIAELERRVLALELGQGPQPASGKRNAGGRRAP